MRSSIDGACPHLLDCARLRGNIDINLVAKVSFIIIIVLQTCRNDCSVEEIFCKVFCFVLLLSKKNKWQTKQHQKEKNPMTKRRKKIFCGKDDDVLLSHLGYAADSGLLAICVVIVVRIWNRLTLDMPTFVYFFKREGKKTPIDNNKLCYNYCYTTKFVFFLCTYLPHVARLSRSQHATTTIIIKYKKKGN